MSEYSPARSIGGPSARAWEEGLDALAQSTDDNLNKLRQFRNTEFHPQQQSQTTIVMKPSGISQRPSSAPRSRGASSYQHLSNANIRTNNAFNNSTREQIDFITTTTSTSGSDADRERDRKIDVLMKRTKATEDKLRKVQTDHMALLDAKNISDLMVEQLCESVKSDRQLIIQLETQVQDLCKGAKSNVVAVGQRVNGPNSNSHNANSGMATAADIESIQEIVYQRVHKEFNKIVSEVVRTCAAEQSLFLQKWSEQQESQVRRKEVDVSRLVEQELARHKSDVLVQQGKLHNLESQVVELRGQVATKDAESHRKIMNSFRAESQSVLESVGRKVNEALAAATKSSMSQSQNESNMYKSISFQNQQLKQLQAWKHEVSEHLGKAEAMTTRSLEHIQRIDDTVAGTQDQIDQCNGYISQIMEQSAEAERSAQRATETVSQFISDQSQAQSQIESQAAQALAQSQAALVQFQQSQMAEKRSASSGSQSPSALQSQMESRIAAALESFNASRKSMQALIDTLHGSMSKLEGDVKALSAVVNARHEEAALSTAHLLESGKKLKNKVQEIITSLNSVSAQQQTAEVTLKQVNARLAQEDQLYNQVLSTTDNLYQRMTELERGAAAASAVAATTAAAAVNATAVATAAANAAATANAAWGGSNANSNNNSHIGGDRGSGGGAQSPTILMSPTPQLFSPPVTSGTPRSSNYPSGTQFPDANSALLDNYRRKFELLEREKQNLRLKYEELLVASSSSPSTSSGSKSADSGLGLGSQHNIQTISVNKSPSMTVAAEVNMDHNDYYSPSHAQHQIQTHKSPTVSHSQSVQEQQSESHRKEAQQFNSSAGSLASINSEVEHASIHATVSASPVRNSRSSKAQTQGQKQNIPPIPKDDSPDKEEGSVRASMEDWLDRQLMGEDEKLEGEFEEDEERDKADKDESDEEAQVEDDGEEVQEERGRQLIEERWSDTRRSNNNSNSNSNWSAPATVAVPDTMPAQAVRTEAPSNSLSIPESRSQQQQVQGRTGAGSPLMQRIANKKTAQQFRREAFLKKAQAEFDEREY